MFTKYDPNTEQGRDFHKILDSCPDLSDAKFGRKDHSSDRKKLEAILSQDRFKHFHDKYKKLKKDKKPRNWYSLCSGIQNLRLLAKKLGFEAEYALFYSHLSEISHSSDVISDRLVVSDKGQTYIAPLRGIADQNLKMLCNTTSMYLCKCHSLIIDSYFPPNYSMRKRFESWYMDYRKFYLWLGGEND